MLASRRAGTGRLTASPGVPVPSLLLTGSETLPELVEFTPLGRRNKDVVKIK
jgi:hypothetical protein